MAKKKKNDSQHIGVDEIRKAASILQKYRAGKTNFDARIISNEQWFKLQHWDELRDNSEKKDKPTSAWLFNSIINKHADAMDSYPMATVLPREESDRQDATLLTSVIKCILDQNHYEDVYSDKWWSKLKNGCSVEAVFWNPGLNNGLGDVDIKEIDILNLYWKPGIKDLEKSPNVFSLELIENDRLLEDYQELDKDDLTKKAIIDGGQYNYDDSVDTDDMSVVVDWYYKKKIDGKMTLQYVKFVNETVIYASENDPATREEGFYAHGMYPFVIDVMFPEQGTPAGFGFLDIMKEPQLYIDSLSGAILKNAHWNARPRYFKRGDDGINEKELLDEEKQIVHVEGSLDENNIKPMTPTQVPSTAITALQMKIDELKETSGNRDVSQGSTSSGVNAASAIAALQEAGSKLTRDSNKSSYRAFEKVCTRVLELIRQFYDEERCFRITKPNGEMDFVNYDNRNIRGEDQGEDFGLDLGIRIPMFDFKVKAEKANSFSTISQNQMAQQFFGMGFFNPQMADQAVACLEMMDFEGKDQLLNKISQNSQLFQQLQQAQMKAVQLAAMLDDATGGNTGAQLLGMGGLMNEGFAQPAPSGQAQNISHANDPLGRAVAGHNSNTAVKARERAQNVGSPR